jgi:pimeloyl-ACP methyl ester carboxylesterase
MKSLFCICLFLLTYNITSAQTQYYKSFDGRKIAYTVKGSGKPVILLHGFTSNKKTWENTPVEKKLLASGYQIIAMDLRGMGESVMPHEEQVYADNAEVKDIMELATQLKLKKYYAVGYSRGSIVLAKLLTKDSRVKKAILGGMGEDFTNPTWDRRLKFADIYGGNANKYCDGRESVKKAVERGLDTLVLSYIQKYQPITSVKELRAIKIPVAIINGDKDRDNGDPEILSILIPKSKLYITNGTHGEASRTELFGEKVLEFLQ